MLPNPENRQTALIKDIDFAITGILGNRTTMTENLTRSTLNPNVRAARRANGTQILDFPHATYTIPSEGEKPTQPGALLRLIVDRTPVEVTVPLFKEVPDPSIIVSVGAGRSTVQQGGVGATFENHISPYATLRYAPDTTEPTITVSTLPANRETNNKDNKQVIDALYTAFTDRSTYNKLETMLKEQTQVDILREAAKQTGFDFSGQFGANFETFFQFVQDKAKQALDIYITEGDYTPKIKGELLTLFESGDIPLSNVIALGYITNPERLRGLISLYDIEHQNQIQPPTKSTRRRPGERSPVAIEINPLNQKTITQDLMSILEQVEVPIIGNSIPLSIEATEPPQSNNDDTYQPIAIHAYRIDDRYMEIKWTGSAFRGKELRLRAPMVLPAEELVNAIIPSDSSETRFVTQQELLDIPLETIVQLLDIQAPPLL